MVKPERIDHTLDVSALIWDRDSHGLFDYESKVLKDWQMETTGSSMLVRDEFSIKTVVPNLDCPQPFQKLVSLVYKKGSYWAYHHRTLYKKDGLLDEDFNHHE